MLVQLKQDLAPADELIVVDVDFSNTPRDIRADFHPRGLNVGIVSRSIASTDQIEEKRHYQRQHGSANEQDAPLAPKPVFRLRRISDRQVVIRARFPGNMPQCGIAGSPRASIMPI